MCEGDPGRRDACAVGPAVRELPSARIAVARLDIVSFPTMAVVAIESITLEPIIGHWTSQHGGTSCCQQVGQEIERVRRLTRQELHLPTDCPILATGHQPTLWHPGILAKYIAVDAALHSEAGQRKNFSGLNIIVDQDVVACGAFDVPFKTHEGRWRARTLDFAPHPPVQDVPAGWQDAFEPVVPESARVDELSGLRDGVARMHAALKSHASARSAATQTAGALSQVMTECCGIEPLPTIMASELMQTTVAVTFLEAMAADAYGCAEAYNRAVAALPDARISPLQIRDDYVELPLWRIRDQGPPQRVRAYDADVERWLAERDSPTRPTLLPRALCMTALIRMAVADVFVHGRGGALYDRVMEQWISEWKPTPLNTMVTATATVRLPLMTADDLALVQRACGGRLDALRQLRMLEHDPESAASGFAHRPGSRKREMLAAIASAPRRSVERRNAFFQMHRSLEEMRAGSAEAIKAAQLRVVRMDELALDAAVALRRDWAFPLYPAKTLAELVERIHAMT